jgi:hypothetical protein
MIDEAAGRAGLADFELQGQLCEPHSAQTIDFGAAGLRLLGSTGKMNGGPTDKMSVLH